MFVFRRLDGEEVRLMLWDTAGQEEFDAITKAYYRGAQACVLAFSTTDRDSFLAAQSWKMKVRITANQILLNPIAKLRKTGTFEMITISKNIEKPKEKKIEPLYLVI